MWDLQNSEPLWYDGQARARPQRAQLRLHTTLRTPTTPDRDKSTAVVSRPEQEEERACVFASLLVAHAAPDETIKLFLPS